jgi:hypothetical protein
LSHLETVDSPQPCHPAPFITAVVLTSAAQLGAQDSRPLLAPAEFAIDQWTTGQGLLQNSVNAIVQGPDGHLWIGTFGGLARFDGTSFSLIERTDSAGRHVDRVLALAVGSDGALWLPLDAYAGRYSGPMYGDATVTVEDGGLVPRLLPNPDLVADLRHLQLDTWVMEWRRPWPWFGKGIAQFIIAPAGEVAELRLDVPNQDLWFHELELRRQ